MQTAPHRPPACAPPKLALPVRRARTATSANLQTPMAPQQQHNPYQHHINGYLDPSLGYCRHLLEGIHAYVAQTPGVSFKVVPIRRLPKRLDSDETAGILLFRPTSVCRSLHRPGLAMVQLSGREEPGEIPTVLPDNHSLGALAAQHLLDRGFQRFACLQRDFRLSKQRCEGFINTVGRAGWHVQVFPETDRFEEPICDWVAAQGRPVGVFFDCDDYAQTYELALLQRGLQVPDQAAIIGVNNDELLCEYTHTPLSSVDPNARIIGFLAARTVHRMLQGHPPDRLHQVVQPAAVVQRRSTDAFATDDPVLRTVLRYIQARACQPIGVEDILDQVPVSRRTLERRFRDAFGRTLHDQIIRARLDHAKHLILRTDLNLERIANRAGFNNVKRFITLFRQKTGTPPGQFRKQNKLARGPTQRQRPPQQPL